MPRALLQHADKRLDSNSLDDTQPRMVLGHWQSLLRFIMLTDIKRLENRMLEGFGKYHLRTNPQIKRYKSAKRLDDPP